MKLVIAEKPSLGVAIAAALGGTKKSDGCISCNDDFVVSWVFGHVYQQANPEDYDPANKKWSRNTLPIIPSSWKMFPSKEASGQLKILKELLKQTKEVYHAGDPDREGQLIVDELLEAMHYKGAVKRLWLHDLTTKGILNSFTNVQDNKNYNSLRDAALARSRADWLFGMNLTRAFSIAKTEQLGFGQGVCSYGRIQTPTLALVVNRDKEIENFISKDYYRPFIQAKKDDVICLAWKPAVENLFLDDANRLVDENEAKRLTKLSGECVITQAKYEKKETAPKLPHCLSSLQKEASAKFKIGANAVLDTVQGLYEKKLVTYPRTDCQYMPEANYNEAQAIISKLASAGVNGASQADSSIKGAVFNDKKVTAHFALSPTGQTASLSGQDLQIYNLICEAYLRQFYPNKKYEQRSIIVSFGGETWAASCKIVLTKGWTSFSGDDDDEKEGKIPAGLNIGDKLDYLSADYSKEKTTPPAYFTEGTLIGAMENVHKYIDDVELKKKLSETAGLGTEATRASIIEVLKKRKFISVQKNQIVSTPEGRDFIKIIPNELKNAGITAIWEQQLEQIVNKELSLDMFLDKQIKFIPSAVRAALETRFTVGDKNIEIYKCPVCGFKLNRWESKKDKGRFFWACSNKEHENSKEQPKFYQDKNNKPV